MLRRIRWVDTNDDEFDLGGTEVGAGINLTSNLKFTENDVGRFAFVFGQGIQNYMNDAPVDVGIELTPGGDPRLSESDGRQGRNYERIFDEARRRVRSWEAAHVN